MTEPIGEQIKRLREARGMSLFDLWGQCHISLDKLRLIESGERQPTVYEREDIACALDAQLEIRLVPDEPTDQIGHGHDAVPNEEG